MSDQTSMNERKAIAVVAGVRTPMAKAFTHLQSNSAVELGTHVVTETLKRCGLAVNDVDEVVFGNVAGPPDSANLARVIALRSGLPDDRIAHTVNRNCASGMESILAGWQAIDEGRAQTVIAGGTESMSNIPFLFSSEAAALWMRLSPARSMKQKLSALASFRPRHFRPTVGIELGLTDPVSGLNMGETAEVLAHEFGITREQQDTFAMNSHHKAEAAQKACFLSGEITAVDRDAGLFDKDNAIRYGQSLDQLAKLRPLFKRPFPHEDGAADWPRTVTAGNSCPLTDGAAAVVLSPCDRLDRFDKEPLGYITDYAIAGCDPRRMGLGPVYATAKLLQQTGRKFDDFELIEINEAFAAQVLACEKAMASKSFAQSELNWKEAVGEIDPMRLNIHGGAIALGHPVGMTGTRLVMTLLRALKLKGKRRGLATLCVGGGQGVAMIVETELE